MLIVPNEELADLIKLHRRPEEADEECVLRLVKLAIHLSVAIDEMAKTAEQLWQTPR